MLAGIGEGWYEFQNVQGSNAQIVKVRDNFHCILACVLQCVAVCVAAFGCLDVWHMCTYALEHTHPRE